jgi:DNA-binding transcriptional regulator YiaG
MAITCNIKEQSIMNNGNDCEKTLPSYEPNVGAPFKVILIDSVRQTFSADGDLLETSIPNLSGLLKEIAFARSLESRKFSPLDIKFVRKAVGLKAIELAELLGVSAEHMSRCENGERTLSIAAEKLLRVIILKKRHNPTELANMMSHILSSDNIDSKKIIEIKNLIERYKTTITEIETAIFDSRINSVYDPEDNLEFSFHLAPPRRIDCYNIEGNQEENWEKEAA